MQVSSTSFRELKKKKVIDADGLPIGTIIDLDFDAAGNEWFVLGGGFVEETLEALHVQPDIDLLVPVEWIDRVERDDIILKIPCFELTSTCEEAWLLEKERLVRTAAASAFDQRAAACLHEYPHRVV